VLSSIELLVSLLHNVSGVRQIEVHTAESLVPGSSHLEVKIVIAELKIHKSPGSAEIPAEPIQAGGDTLLSAIYKHINYIGNRDGLPDNWKKYIILSIHKKGDKTDWNNYRGI
jgi:hypothetical protein